MKNQFSKCRILWDKDWLRFVRLGIQSSDSSIQSLNIITKKIQELFLKNIENLTKTITVKAMLGDNTVTNQKTFDPINVEKFYNKIINNLSDWTTQGISISNNEDTRRIFIKFQVKVENYLLSGHLSLQYHVLLFYKPDNKVIQYQKEFSDIIDKAKNAEVKLAKDSNQFVLEKLKKNGHKDLDHLNLFKVFFENDEMREKIYKVIKDRTNADFKNLAKRKKYLLKELDNLLIETYQTTPILIDDTRLIGGEEGCLCNFDIEFIKNKIKEGMFDPKKMPLRVKKKFSGRLKQIMYTMKI